MAVAHARPRERAEILRKLLTRGDTVKSRRDRLHLLAMACLEHATELDPRMRADGGGAGGQAHPAARAPRRPRNWPPGRPAGAGAAAQLRGAVAGARRRGGGAGCRRHRGRIENQRRLAIPCSLGYRRTAVGSVRHCPRLAVAGSTSTRPGVRPGGDRTPRTTEPVLQLATAPTADAVDPSRTRRGSTSPTGSGRALSGLFPHHEEASLRALQARRPGQPGVAEAEGNELLRGPRASSRRATARRRHAPARSAGCGAPSSTWPPRACGHRESGHRLYTWSCARPMLDRLHLALRGRTSKSLHRGRHPGRGRSRAAQRAAHACWSLNLYPPGAARRTGRPCAALSRLEKLAVIVVPDELR